MFPLNVVSEKGKIEWRALPFALCQQAEFYSREDTRLPVVGSAGTSRLSLISKPVQLVFKILHHMRSGC